MQQLSKQHILKIYEQIVQKKQLVQHLQKENHQFQISNLVGSSLSFIISESFKVIDKPILLLLNDKEEAAYYLNDLEQLINDKDVFFYPGSYRRPYQIDEVDNANILLRSEVLNRLNSRKKPALIVTYADALFEQVVTKAELNRNTLKISVNDNLSLDFVNEVLFEYHFERVDFVSEPGEFSVRGGIIDVFSFSQQNPSRIEFIGNEIESLRSFSVDDQLSLNNLVGITLVSNIEDKCQKGIRQSLISYSKNIASLWIQDPSITEEKIEACFEHSKKIYQNLNSITKRFLVGKSNITNIYDELITSGKFNLLKSKELRNELTAFNLNLQLLASYEDLQNNFVDNHLSPFLNDNINKLEILAKKDSIDLFLYGKTLKFDFSNLPKNINPSHNIFLKNEKFTNLLVELIEHTERLLPIYDRLGKSISKIDSLVINKIH